MDRRKIVSAVSSLLWAKSRDENENRHHAAIRACRDLQSLHTELCDRAAVLVSCAINDGELEREATPEAVDEFIHRKWPDLRPEVLRLGNGS